VRLTDADLPDIYDTIYGFWEDIAGDDGAMRLQDLYDRGLRPRPADQYLFDLGTDDIFTFDQIDELERQLPIIRAANYPDDVKAALTLLLRKLKREQRNQISNVVHKKARNQAIRNVYEISTGENAAPGRGFANRIREMNGLKIPRGAMGGRRTRRRKIRKTRKASRKSVK
jgi:plasmid maintenance system killer protein